VSRLAAVVAAYCASTANGAARRVREKRAMARCVMSHLPMAGMLRREARPVNDRGQDGWVS
jgi:hypothetical protein